MENHTTSFQNRDCRDIKQPEVLSGNKKTPDKRIPSNASSSSSDMEVQLSDVDVYQMYANSNSSGFSEMQSSSSEAGKSKDGNYDDENNCIPLINGSIVLSLMEAKMWHKFLELGTEMIINRSGRRMFPYVEFFLKGVDPAGLYDVMFDIIPASSKSFKFLNNKWIPIGKKDEEFKNHPFKHPDSPRIGSDWMSRKISFEKIKLSNNPDTCTKDGIFTLHTFQKYFVSIYIVKHEEDDELSVMDFPIRDTTFIAVTAYNNRKVTKLKINSNPYSKGFRFPVKRPNSHTFEELDNKGERLVTYDDCVKNSLYCHPDEIPISLQPNSHTFVELNNEVERPVTYDDCVKNSIFCHPDEIPVTLQGPLDLSIKKDSKKTKGEYEKDKEAQTDITIGDAKTWFSFLGYPLTDKSADMALSFFHMFPYLTRKMREQDICIDGQRMGFPERYPEFKSSNQHSNATDVYNDGQRKGFPERYPEFKSPNQHAIATDVCSDGQRMVFPDRYPEFKSPNQRAAATDVCSDGQRMVFPDRYPEFKSPNQRAAATDVCSDGQRMVFPERYPEFKSPNQHSNVTERYPEFKSPNQHSTATGVCSDGQRMVFPERYPEFKSPNQHSNATAKAVNKENSLQSTEREREMRKERLKEYNTRIEMWKRDKEGIYPDNSKQMKNSW